MPSTRVRERSWNWRDILNVSVTVGPRPKLFATHSACERPSSIQAVNVTHHGLGEPHPLLVASLVRQEAVAIGVHQLHHRERRTAGTTKPPSRRGGHASPRSIGAKQQRSSLSSSPTSSTPSGISVPPATRVRNQRDEAVGRHRREAEDGDVGEGNRVGHANRVRVGRASADRSSGRASTGSSAQPLVSIIQPIFSACGIRKSGRLHRRIVHQTGLRSGPTTLDQWHVGGGG